jgi:Flp pilus assembly protein TadD
VGTLLLAGGDLEGAAAALGTAIENGGENLSLLLRLGQAQVGLGRWAGAASTYRRAAELAPGSGEIELALARCLVGTGDVDGAAAALDRAESLGGVDGGQVAALRAEIGRVERGRG